ncbi:MAG: hypothetical protein QOG69_522, partial [Actinomycetota bacterium]|nr:hypothetical protein [Actinomycetota bacterium]
MVALIVVSCASRQPGGIVSRQSAVASLSGVTPSVPTTDAGTAAALIHDHWSQLPDAPITPRLRPAVAWTGTRMLVWGGIENSYGSDSQVFADGASYDPAGRHWTTMAAAPLNARIDMGSVWTGGGLFIWGGDEGVGR